MLRLTLAAGIGDGQLAVYYLFRSHGSKRKQLHQIQGFDASRRMGDVATAVFLPSRRLLDDGSLAVETAPPPASSNLQCHVGSET